MSRPTRSLTRTRPPTHDSVGASLALDVAGGVPAPRRDADHGFVAAPCPRRRSLRDAPHGLVGRGTARQGMTLVEILIVIAILGSLMALVAVNVAGRFEEANVDTTKLTIQKIESELGIYAARHKGKYPTTSEGLEAAYKGDKIPVDAWGQDFQYFSPGTHGDNAYEIISLGGDGKEGGDDTDADINSWELGS